MREIGIRELKAQASAILREVREQGEHFEVTYHGRVIARIVPVSQPQTEPASVAEFLARLDQVAADIGQDWPEGVSAVDAVREGRREFA